MTKAEEEFKEWWRTTGRRQYPDVPMMQAQDIFTLGWRAGMGERFREQNEASKKGRRFGSCVREDGGVF